ncbi:hypothetical protein TIFTF001_039790 [Ficus carica]|uniref:Uncharacterized protein n=1 Tax=Ficus carica TaxID=3494 RepID=A0AA87Z5R1_FICCA|nr:hypothetical protein TIFTF001_039790 [Ficus carica]
MITCVLSR